MSDLNNENTQPAAVPESPAPQKLLSPPAKWAFRTFLIGGICIIVAASLSPLNILLIGRQVMFICSLAGAIFWLVAVLLGIVALFHIRYSKKQFSGVLRSFASVLIPIIVFSICCYLAVGLAYRLMCGVNIGGLGKALEVYCNDYGKLPTSSHWNDLLMERADVSVRQFMCRGADVMVGECAYAMNKYVADMNMAQLPKDVVVLFETDSGKTAKRGWWKLRQLRKNENEYYSVTESNGIPKLTRSDKLDKLRWNQVGGPEILSTAHHRGKGCNILFGDGDPKFVETKDIPNLRWKP